LRRIVATSARPPGVSVMRCSITFLDHRDRQVFQQCHALAQRRLERDLAAHRALGDRRHMRPSAPHSRRARRCIPGLIIGGIHVGDEQPLAPRATGLHDDVDRRAASSARTALAVALSSVPSGVKECRPRSAIEPAAALAPQQSGARNAKCRVVERRPAPDWR
jgi:hypothetical protein